MIRPWLPQLTSLPGGMEGRTLSKPSKDGAQGMQGVSCSFFKFLVLKKQLHGLKEPAAGQPPTLTF